MTDELEFYVRRLEQQLITFEKLHTDEMRRFKEQFAAYQRVQGDELRMLREELHQLQARLAQGQTSTSETNAPTPTNIS